MEGTEAGPSKAEERDLLGEDDLLEEDEDDHDDDKRGRKPIAADAAAAVTDVAAAVAGDANGEDAAAEGEGDGDKMAASDSNETSAGPKVYEKKYFFKKATPFPVGFDVLTPEEQEKKKLRAQRFGAPETVDVERQKRLARFGGVLSLRDFHGREPKHTPSAEATVRMNALHLYGTDDKETSEIMPLFQDYAPSHIEWVNDSSCNVVWEDEFSCGRALAVCGEPLADVPRDAANPWLRCMPAAAAGMHLIFRRATSEDVKKPGAAKKSKFYARNGMPQSSNSPRVPISNSGGGGGISKRQARRERAKAKAVPAAFVGDLREQLSRQSDSEQIARSRMHFKGRGEVHAMDASLAMNTDAEAPAASMETEAAAAE
eukprot:m.167254 g.167254  ORF g.167254 m.167254 type:complete len:373 (-) comp17191_c2_seq2:1930-3048(-)